MQRVQDKNPTKSSLQVQYCKSRREINIEKAVYNLLVSIKPPG